MSWLDHIRWRHIAWGTVVLVLLALLSGCTGQAGYILTPDASVSVTRTSGGASLVGGDRCTLTLTGELPAGTTYVYSADGCVVRVQR